MGVSLSHPGSSETPRRRLVRPHHVAAALRRGRSMFLLVAVVVGGWWSLTAYGGVSSLVLPAPVDVLASGASQWRLLATETSVTLAAAGAGFLGAVVLGLGAAVLISHSEAIGGFLMPGLVALNATPKVVVAPILIIWLGLGAESKIAMAFLLCVFPIVINSTQGLKDVPPELIDLYRLFRASRFEVLWRVRFPNALPAIFDGMKIALPLALIGAVIGEFVGSRRGIGYQLVLAYARFNTEFVFAGVIVLTAVSVGLFYVLLGVERRVVWWRLSFRTS